MQMNSFCTPDRCDSCTERVVCRCLDVTETALLELLTTRDVRTIKEVRRFTGAGDGCTACHAEIKRYIEKYT
jgi:bacterioferritin-associated ferredoxin